MHNAKYARLAQPRGTWLGGLCQTLDEEGKEFPKSPCIALNFSLGGLLADEVPNRFHLVGMLQSQLALLILSGLL